MKNGFIHGVDEVRETVGLLLERDSVHLQGMEHIETRAVDDVFYLLQPQSQRLEE